MPTRSYSQRLEARGTTNGSSSTSAVSPTATQHVTVDPETGELLDCPQCLRYGDEIAGYVDTIKWQSRRIGQLERQLGDEEESIAAHPKGKEIVGLVKFWMEKTGHERSQISTDRIKLIKSRLRDGYTVEQVELAIEGLAAVPYVVNAQRKPTGKPSQRYDQLKHALKGGQELERFANIGAEVRKAAK